MRARISLRSLFAIIAFAAIATAVLLRPTFFLASAVWSLTLLILAATIVAAFASNGKSRAFWSGFAFLGGLHFVLATAPWFDLQIGEYIVTSQVLDFLGGMLEYEVADRQPGVNMPGVWTNLRWGRNEPPTDSYGYLNYVMAGQSTFSLVIGYVGGAAGRFFYSRRPAS